MNYPSNLLPISTSPWDERPEELPLDIEECRTALWISNGNILKAAEQLKVPSRRLRNFVKSSPYLQREIEEAGERIADMAEVVVVAALSDEKDPGRQDSMARFVLAGQHGKKRGYGNNNGTGGSAKVQIGSIVIQWATEDDNAMGDGSKTIEGTVNDAE